VAERGFWWSIYGGLRGERGRLMVMFYAMKSVTRILGLFSGVSLWELRSRGLGLFGLTNSSRSYFGLWADVAAGMRQVSDGAVTISNTEDTISCIRSLQARSALLV
jgi:hypothetical protein